MPKTMKAAVEHTNGGPGAVEYRARAQGIGWCKSSRWTSVTLMLPRATDLVSDNDGAEVCTRT
jgi:hypothetical protein